MTANQQHSGIGRFILLGLAATAVLVAWGFGISRRGFDYDEIYHAHAIWLIWQGQVPYHDFFACHPPFAWYAIAPLWGVLPDSPESLIPFRVVASLGVAAWLVTIAENVRLGRDIPRKWIYLCLLLMLVQPSVIDFALEFRPDAWWYALLFGAILLFRLNRPRKVVPRYAVFAFLSSWAVLATPKCVLLTTFFVLFELVTTQERRHWLKASLGLASGIALAAGAAGCCLRQWSIDVDAAYIFGIRYQATFMAHTGFRYGLLHSLLAQPLLLSVAGASVLAWGMNLKQRHFRPNAFELAVILFLLIQPCLVQRPYKQYYGPWLITAAGFAPYLGISLRQRLSTSPSAILYGTVSALTIATSLRLTSLFAAQDGAESMLRFYDSLLNASDRSSAIVASLPLHPVVRRDSFYAWSRTTDPTGFSTESIIKQLDVPEYAGYFDKRGYQRQLAEHPPDIIVPFVEGTTSYEPQQAAVLAQYLREQRENYTLLESTNLCPVWQRVKQPTSPDRGH